MLDAVLDGINAACPGCLYAVQQQSSCSGMQYNKLPDLAFTLGGHEVTLPHVLERQGL